MLAVLLAAVLCVGLVSNSVLTSVLAQEESGTSQSVGGNEVEPAQEETKTAEGAESDEMQEGAADTAETAQDKEMTQEETEPETTQEKIEPETTVESEEETQESVNTNSTAEEETQESVIENSTAEEETQESVSENSAAEEGNRSIQNLLERIAVLPDAEEYLAAEPDMEDEEAYVQWEEKLYEYAQEALAIWEEYEALTEEQQAQIVEEELAKLTAWVEIEEALSENTMVMAADGEHGTHSGWTELRQNTTTLTAGKDYYLNSDIEMSSVMSISGTGTVNLCLNGHQLTLGRSAYKAWLLTVPAGVTLNVYDCAGVGSLGADKDTTNREIGGIRVQGELNVYGGSICGRSTSTITHSGYQTDSIALAYCSGIYADRDSVVALYGGSIEGRAASGVYVESGAKLSVDGGNAKCEADFTSSNKGNIGVIAAAIYVDAGGTAEVKSGKVLSFAIHGENMIDSRILSIMVIPTGSLTVSGGEITATGAGEMGERNIGVEVYEDGYWITENVEGPTRIDISGGIITSVFVRGGDDEEINVTGGEITGVVSLWGSAMKLAGNQQIGTAFAETEDIAINRLNNGKGYGTVVLTGALTNSVPYLVGTYRTPSSQYPIVFTENFTTYMSGKTPTEYFKSVNGYKVVLLNGEAALMPYVMTFDANGGACETKTGDIGGGNPLRALPEPTRTGYSSDGWYTSKTGGDKITIDAMPSGKDITVYAHWTPVDYAITYDLADGTLQDGDSNPATYHIETPDFTLKNPVRAGYVFTGWSGTGLTGIANKTVTISKGSTGERTYTAHWEEVKYKVTVNTYKNNVLWSSGAPAVKLTADNGTSFITDFTAVGNGSYRIYSGNTNTGVTVTVGGADAAARVDYYTLSFYDRDSELTQNRQTVLKNNMAQKPSAPTRTGYLFAGWCDNANLTGTPVTEISTPITAKQTFYAKWTAAEYKVTFDYQGATGDSTVADKTVTYDAAYGELPAPTKTGYVFKGWYTSENGQGNPVTAATVVQTASAHTLYAYWKDETAPDKPVLQDGVTLPADWTNAQDTIPLKLYDSVGVTALLVSVDGSRYAEVSGFSGGTGSINYSCTVVQEGEHKYQFKAVDAAGNFAESDLFTVKLDQTKPKIGTLTYENEAHRNLWHWIIGKKSMIVHVPVTDTGSGVPGISFCLTSRDAAGNLDSGNAVTDTATVSGGEAKITFDADFRGIITINCTDEAGNAADSVTIGKDVGGVIVEDRAPDITIQADRYPSDTQQTQPGGVAVSEGYYDSAPALLVTVKDDTENAITAGIATVKYRIENGAEQFVTVNTSALQKEVIFTIPASEIPTGITEITAAAADNAGNEAAKRFTVKVKGPEKTPAAEIGYREEKLTKLIPGERYTIDGTEYTADGEGCIPIKEDWFNSAVSIIKNGNGSETSDSTAQNLSIPARPAAPGVPELSTRDDKSITLKTITGAQYRLADGTGNWQDSTAFEGLDQKTIYIFKAYYPATDTGFASAESSPAQIATIPTAPAPDKLAVSYENETFTLHDGVEAFTGQSCTTPVTAGSVEAYMGQTIYIRYPAKGIIPESLTTAVPIPGRPATPTPGKADASYPGARDGAITGLTSGTAYEYRVKDQNGNFGTWQDAELDGTGIGNLPAGEYEVRVKAVETGNASFRSEAAAVTIGEKPATKYETPDIRIDYMAETLTGFEPGAAYAINGKTITVSADGIIKIEADWFETTLSVVHKSNGKDKLDSDAQSLPVPARPQKPTPIGVDVNTAGGTGKLAGLTAGTSYEVSADGGRTWETKTANGNGEITGLASDTYVVRVKAGASNFASENSDAATIGAYKVTVTLQGGTGYTLSAENGSASPVKEGGSFTFRFALQSGYHKTGSFAVKVNGVKVKLTSDETYTITDIREKQTVAVQGVAKKTGGKPSNPGRGGDNKDDPDTENDDQPTPQPPSPTNPPGQPQLADSPQPPSPTNPPGQPQPSEKPDNRSGIVPGTPDSSQTEDKQEPESAGTPNPTGKTSETGKGQQPEEGGVQTVPVSIDNGKIVISGESAATGNVEGMTDTSTSLKLGDGAVIVTVVCTEQEYTAGVTDTIAVANAVLTPGQMELVNNGETIEIRIDVKDISAQMPEQDKKVIENGIEEYQKEVPELTLGMYVDISMFIRIGEGDWNSITETAEAVDIVIGIPENLQKNGRTYYVIRAHDGAHTFMKDMDDVSGTITIRTEVFSSYAIAYVETDGAGADEGQKCSLCHICPTFLGLCCFVWLAMIVLIMIVMIILLRKKKENSLT